MSLSAAPKARLRMLRRGSRVRAACGHPGGCRSSARRNGPRRSNAMDTPMYPQSSVEIARKRRELAPRPLEAFRAFSAAVFADGALPARTKQLIAVAVAHVTQCPYCIRGHTEGALKAGASEAEIMEAIWVAAEMRAGGAYAHSALAIDAMAAHAHAAPTHST